MNTLSRALLTLTLMAAITPALAGEVPISLKDIVKGLAAEAKALKTRHKTAASPAVVPAASADSLPAWIGLNGDQLGDKGYGTIVGCASPNPDYDINPEGQCEFHVGLHVNNQTHANLAVVLSKTHLKNMPIRQDIDDRVDYGYVSTDAVAAMNDPRYDFGAQNCMLDGRTDTSVFGFYYDKGLAPNLKDPQRNALNGKAVKAWRADYATGKIVPIDPSRVQCPTVT